MKKSYENFLRIEFESRIFVSFSIVLITGLLTFLFFSRSDSVIILIGKYFKISAPFSKSIGFLSLAVLMFIVSIIRMRAGSLLTPKRVMTFKIQTDQLTRTGPYILTRNPIYFADLIAICGFSICFPLIGLIMPLLFYIHYSRLIEYEERSLKNKFGKSFNQFVSAVPKLFPSFKSIFNFIKSKDPFIITETGFRHNALYLLFIPGFIISALTHDFIFALFIGLPGVIDWAVVHTKIGIGKTDKVIIAPELKTKTNKKVFNDILYSNCWEDPQIDREAFMIRPDDIIFSITSGGCNVLTFLLDNPKKIIALDMNKYQNFLLELKISAFQNLTYVELLEFLGIKKSNRRKQLYMRIKNNLSLEAYEYWNKNFSKIKSGIINCGRYEKYMKLLRITLRIIEGRKLINKFFEIKNFEERKKLYNQKWNNLRWRFFTKIFLSRRTMSLLFDKAFFKYLNESFSFGDHFSEKTKRALTEMPVNGNYFLSLILLGNYFNNESLAHYLKMENFEIIKRNVDKIEIINSSCEKYFSLLPDSCISKFNFTNIFEWMPDDQFEKLLRETVRVAENKAVITYRNLLVPREHPHSLENYVYSEKELAGSLLKKDLSFIYNNYVVEKIIKEENRWDIKLNKYQTAEI